jgi:large subunit ribosomal protein L6
MSRLAKKPMTIPKGVELKINDDLIHAKGKKGELVHKIDKEVIVEIKDNLITIKPVAEMNAMVGTTCKLLGNIMHGVSEGFERKLTLVGVGYRAKTQGKILELSLGFSHPVQFEAPAGITIDTPSNTEIIIKGMDRQVVGETAAKIRAFRPPELYKGKGVRYSDEQVTLKEVKKK